MNAPETFKDAEGGLREVNTWYPLPFVVRRAGMSIAILPVRTDSVHAGFLQVKTEDGETYQWTPFGRIGKKKVAWRVWSKPVI